MSPVPDTPLSTVFLAQQAAYARERDPSLAQRLARLARLRQLLSERETALADAISADFGHRSRHETVIAETFIVRSAIAHTRRHLKRWMARRRVATAFHSLPASSWV